MDKRRAVQIIVKAAGLYHLNLEDQKVLFLYGIPSKVEKQLNIEGDRLPAIKSYEVVFHRYNFLHLTGVGTNGSSVGSAIHFYEKCLANRLKEEDFYFAKDGSTVQKLEVLENMMGDLKCPVTSSNHGLCNGYPWVIVAENSGIFFISGRIRGNFSKL